MEIQVGKGILEANRLPRYKFVHFKGFIYKIVCVSRLGFASNSIPKPFTVIL